MTHDQPSPTAPVTPGPSGYLDPPGTRTWQWHRPGPIRRFLHRHPRLVDAVVIAWFAVPALATAIVTLHRREEAGQWVTLAAIILAALALWWRRSRPLTVLGVVAALGTVSMLVNYESAGFELGVALALYTVTVSRGAAVAWSAFALSGGALALAVLVTSIPESVLPDNPEELGAPEWVVSMWTIRISSVLGIWFFSLAALAIGVAVRNRRQQLHRFADRTAQLALERDQREQLAVVTERARIAREMHDVVAHSLSVMITLSDGAAATLERDPAKARAVLHDASETGRAALTDMRRVLGALRQDDDELHAPQPTAGLSDLIGRFQTANLPVSLTQVGGDLPADAGLRLAVYRVVQEALTNVLRYAPFAPSVSVTLQRLPGSLSVEVANGTGADPTRTTPGSGRGLIGMRERVAILGGTLEAGPIPGGWRVRALIPWEDDA